MLAARDEPRETHVSDARRFSEAGEIVDARRAGFSESAADGCSVRTGLTLRAGWWTGIAHHCALVGEPHLAGVFRHRHRQHQRGFGHAGEPPSHPELLDWLAVEFMDHDWSMKAMHRLIVISATYRQSSNVTPELYERDPDNRLLARGPRFRVDAEIVRDIALAASGLLNPAIGGPERVSACARISVSAAGQLWAEDLDRIDTGADRYRRALYTFRFRSVPYPMLQTFDAPNGDSTCVRRARSNTPLQALTTLNEPLFVEMARALAMKTLTRRRSRRDAQRLDYALRRCVVAPTDAEGSGGVAAACSTKQKQRYADGKRIRGMLAADDPAQPPMLPPGATPVEVAAWTAVSRVHAESGRDDHEGIVNI